MPKYRVEWVLDEVEAESTAAAAIMALNVQKGEDLPQTTFRVIEHGAEGQDPVIVVLNMVDGPEDPDEVVAADDDFNDIEIPPGATLQ